MKKIILGVGIILVSLLGAILIVPSFIDWNDYKPEIASQAKKATGRALSIEGDIRIAILPTPALVAHNVRFANAEGRQMHKWPNSDRLKFGWPCSLYCKARCSLKRLS